MQDRVPEGVLAQALGVKEIVPEHHLAPTPVDQRAGGDDHRDRENRQGRLPDPCPQPLPPAREAVSQGEDMMAHGGGLMAEPFRKAQLSAHIAERGELAPRAPARDLGVGALLASAGLIASFAALGLNSIAVSRIEGPDGAGLVALSTQVVVIATFVAGIGMRTSVAYRVSAGLWSPRSAVHGALRASTALGLVGATLGFGVYLLLRDSAMSEFSPAMAASLMGALPFALVWWIAPAVPLACERFEQYALLTGATPLAVLVACPSGALLGGSTGTVIGFAAGFVAGGAVTGAWALRFARTQDAGRGPEHGVREAGGFGLRAWVNDLFQFINVRPDLFILSAYYGAGETGVYAVTVSITSLVWILFPAPGVGRPAADGEPRDRERGRATDGHERASGLRRAPRGSGLRPGRRGSGPGARGGAARLGSRVSGASPSSA